jgi:hypothetical protein
VHFALFGMPSRAFGPYLMANIRIIVSPAQTLHPWRRFPQQRLAFGFGLGERGSQEERSRAEKDPMLKEMRKRNREPLKGTLLHVRFDVCSWIQVRISLLNRCKEPC